MNNVVQAQELPLTVWAGAIPEMSATDLPAGGSPFNQDCDFSIGKVYTRPGIISIFDFQTGAPVGPLNPGVGINGGGNAAAPFFNFVNASGTYRDTNSYTFNIGTTLGTWSPEVATSVGTLLVDSNSNVQRCTVAGTTNNTAHPTWEHSVGAPTQDGTVTWTCVKYIISQGDTIVLNPFWGGDTSVTITVTDAIDVWTAVAAQQTAGSGYNTQVWSTVASADIPYGSSIAVTVAYSESVNTDVTWAVFSNLGAANNAVANSSGSAVPTWSSDITVTGTEVFLSISTAVSAATVGAPFEIIAENEAGNNSYFALYGGAGGPETATAAWTVDSSDTSTFSSLLISFPYSPGPYLPPLTAWTSPGNITFGNPATFSAVSLTSSTDSQNLQALNYNLNVPAGVTIQGVQVAITSKGVGVGGEASFDQVVYNGGNTGSIDMDIGPITPSALNEWALFSYVMQETDAFPWFPQGGGSAITSFSISAGVMTVVGTNNLVPGQAVVVTSTGGTPDGVSFTVATASSGGWTATTSLADGGGGGLTAIASVQGWLNLTYDSATETSYSTSYFGLIGAPIGPSVAPFPASQPFAIFDGSPNNKQYMCSLGTFLTTGSAPVSAESGKVNNSVPSTIWDMTQGNTIIVWLVIYEGFGALTITDTQLNEYTIISNQSGTISGTGPAQLVTAVATASATGSNRVTVSQGTSNEWVGIVNEMSNLASLPSGTMTIAPNDAVVGAESHTFPLTLPSNTLTFGGPSDLWGMPWSDALTVNGYNFGFNISAAETAGNAGTYSVSEVQVTVWGVYPVPNSFLYVKTYEQQDGTILTLALADSGTWYQENVSANPGILAEFYNTIEPDTYAKSFTLFNREFIALSNLTNGTDMPRSYDGTNMDRLSQVGPGAAPSIGSTATSSAIASITQGPTVTIPNAQWTSGPNSHTPGNVIIPYSQDPNFTTGGNLPDPTLQVGTVVYLDFTAPDFIAANGTYLVTSVGQATGMEDGDGTLFYYFTVQAPSTNQYNVHGGVAGTYQPTLATMTLANPTNTLDVGTAFAVTGVTPGAWDSTWSVIATLNGAQLNINETSLSADVALYNYTLVSGVAPVVGQLVTVIGCTNGPVTGPLGAVQSIFNVASAAITSVGVDSFSIFPINAPNVAAGAENDAKAIVSGTEYTFDPGLGLVGSITDPIFGDGSGGSLVQAGGLGAGLRSAVVIFVTRNEYLTAPSAPIVFELTSNANAVTATNIPIGPPNVIARIVAFTGASGSQYYWIPIPVTVVDLGVPTTYSATIINDNTTTSATFNFTDAVLLSANEIDISGDNLFQQVELGSCLGVIAYSGRVFAWGEQNKVNNFVNMTFDGGSLAITTTTASQPLGWTVDPTYGAGGSLVSSPLFGQAYYILNTTGSEQAYYGMLTQTAYEDFNNVPIINPQKQYGARVTASCPSQIGSGNLVVDLYSPSFNLVYGSYTIPLVSLGTGMSINTGNLLTAEFVTEASLPTDLSIRVYANNLLSGGDVMIDRIEPFDLSAPVLTTQFRASYENNPEAFDGITGNCGPNQDAKPILGAGVLFDSLYALKKGSMYSTADNGTTEPSTWGWKTVSSTIGTVGIHAYDFGEDWLAIADKSGLYVFGGGPVTKVSQEIQPVWKMITNMETMVVRNDLVNRRITVQVCIPTPNKYMPEMPANAAPTSPNVMLMLNYREVDSVQELASMKPLHQTYMGTIKAFDMSRKWGYWNIQSPYADFCERADGTTQLLICNGAENGKIYELGDTQYSDDGVAINSWYTTFGFPGVEGAQAMQLGNHELELVYGTMTVVGSGTLLITEYPNDPLNPNAQTILPIALAAIPPLGDVEIPLNDIGERFFIRVGTFAVGDTFTLSKMVMTIRTCPWFPVKGVGF